LDQQGTWHYIDETQRRQWQNPEDILSEAGLKPGHTFVDLGCGAGFFTIPAARIVGLKGKIYGVDAQQSSIDEIKKKASAEGLTNLDLTTAKAEETVLCQTCADIVFFGIVLHDFKDPAKVLSNAYQMLKPNGRLVDLDWKKINMSFGPPLSRRFDEAKASILIEQAGFRVETIKDSGQYHYHIIARLKSH
jgi:ubiquinone/menaquinone biosynthesis C-methylase UbiE